MTASQHSGPARQPLIDVDDISKHFGSAQALSSTAIPGGEAHAGA